MLLALLLIEKVFVLHEKSTFYEGFMISLKLKIEFCVNAAPDATKIEIKCC